LERRLAAILAADVVGYSRLMNEDEAATLDALKTCEHDLIEPVVERHHGRIVKRMGDGFLVEFASAVDAVNCALDWQQPREVASPIRFRIGINLGDVIARDDDIFGDGVNVASRLEGLAEAGGVCISAAVHEQVRRRIETAFCDLGEKALKNIEEPVRVFAWSRAMSGLAPKVAGAAAPDAATGMLLVVPFRAIGGDPQAAMLSEALTESIAVAMSHFDELDIVDPGAVPARADAASDRELGRELGVPFLLEGRVQAVGDKVRISVQIIEVASGLRKWSERFDRDAGDVFALQDELTAIVASTVGEALLDLLSSALDARPEETWSALELTIRGTAHLHRLDPQQNLIARAYYEKALAKDPQRPLAIVCECWTYAMEVSFGWPLSRPDNIDYCIARLRDLFARSERHSQAHRLLARLLHMKGDHASALRHSERAYELNPYDSDMIMSLGLSYCYTGEGRRGAELMERACRINPYAPDYYKANLAMGYAIAGRYADALAVLDALPRPIAHARYARAVSLVMLDRLPEAHQEVEAILAEHPDLTLAAIAQGLPIRPGPDQDRLLDALRHAGLPE